MRIDKIARAAAPSATQFPRREARIARHAHRFAPKDFRHAIRSTG